MDRRIREYTDPEYEQDIYESSGKRSKDHERRGRSRRCRRKRHFRPLILLLVLILGIGCAYFAKNSSGTSCTYDPANWNLVLVNRKHPIPKNYKVGKLVTLSDGQKVSAKIYPSLQQMFDDARATGLQLFVASGYRTQAYQQKLLDEKYDEYKNDGYSRAEAKKKAEAWVAVPGTSEHQLGLAVDINADTSVCSKDAVYDWLDQNSYKYGFIHRYPSDKTDITGVINEPWHYRYVGVEAATEIHEKGITLEEYLDET